METIRIITDHQNHLHLQHLFLSGIDDNASNIHLDASIIFDLIPIQKHMFLLYTNTEVYASSLILSFKGRDNESPRTFNFS